jgi:integration host factor subunit alpha
MTLTRKDLIESVSNCTGVSKAQSKRTIENLFEILKENLANGEDVLISGFGKFLVKDKGWRRGRNPMTGEDLMLEQRRVVRFRCAGVLKARINGLG